MIAIVQQQYQLARFSRRVVLDFLETTLGHDINTPISAYQNQTILFLMEHNAGCYFHWLAHFALGCPDINVHDKGRTTIAHIRRLYAEVDELVAAFFAHFEEKMDVGITRVFDDETEIATPLQLFTHTLTHEFHHKGQIALMCRLLGYTPPDTDVSGVWVAK